MRAADPDIDQALDDVAHGLAETFEISPSRARERLERVRQRWRNAKVQKFVPIFAERRVREELREHPDANS
jgi:hypothetical protein